jgi:phosphatidylethanolamine/phosphatidyl-N-methylethanolamine N-methyltransferase
MWRSSRVAEIVWSPKVLSFRYNRLGVSCAADILAFIGEAARDPAGVGALCPSGLQLSQAMTMPVRAMAGQPISVLEAGAGTGAVTRALIAELPAGSRLDVIEANPRLAAKLNRIADAQPVGNAQIRIHPTRIEGHEADAPYDVIASCLPLSNFPPQQVEAIMQRYFTMLHPGGVLIYFSYLGMRWARTLVASREATRRHRAVDQLLAGFQRQYGIQSRRVWVNMPPAAVRQLRRPPQHSAEPHHLSAS